MRGWLATLGALWCAGVPAWAGPVSQGGDGAVGVLQLAQEPAVDLVGTTVAVELQDDVAVVTLTWVLSSKTSRAVVASVGAARGLTQRDGIGPIPAAWTNAEVSLDGQALPATMVEEFPARPELWCGAAPVPARGQWLRVKVQLKGGKAHRLVARFTRGLAHDDWRGADGSVDRSDGTVCVRARPLAFRGKTAGLWTLQVDGPAGVTVTPSAVQGQVRDLSTVEDVVVHLPAAARVPRHAPN